MKSGCREECQILIPGRAGLSAFADGRQFRPGGTAPLADSGAKLRGVSGQHDRQHSPWSQPDKGGPLLHVCCMSLSHLAHAISFADGWIPDTTQLQSQTPVTLGAQAGHDESDPEGAPRRSTKTVSGRFNRASIAAGRQACAATQPLRKARRRVAWDLQLRLRIFWLVVFFSALGEACGTPSVSLSVLILFRAAARLLLSGSGCKRHRKPLPEAEFAARST